LNKYTNEAGNYKHFNNKDALEGKVGYHNARDLAVEMGQAMTDLKKINQHTSQMS
jgi:hypothetical protein